MAPVPRPADFLDRHDNHARRIRALETGAHPLPVTVDYAARFPYTRMVSLDSDWIPSVNEGVFTAYAAFEKRLGVVQFRGGWTGPLEDVPAQTYNVLFPEGGVKVAQLPAAVWPPGDHVFPVTLSVAPFFTRIMVRADGSVVILNTPGITTPTSGGHVVYIDQVNYIAVTPET